MVGFRRIAGPFINAAIYAVLLLVPAGTIHWPRAWIFLAVVLVAAALSIHALPDDLLNERYGAPVQRGQPLADRILLLVFVASFCAVMILIPLDVFRFHLMPPPPLWLAALGLALFAAGWWFITAAMIANAFAAPVVKHQAERGHRVIDTGPYRFVRHPMYSAAIPLLVGTALWLGSYVAAIAAVVPVVLIGTRAVLEERFLRRELPGYAQYAARTRFRLIPYLW